MQHTDKAIAEFEAAFVEGMVEEFGEGYRSSAEFMLTDGSVIAKYAKLAWFASRAAIEIELTGITILEHNGCDFYEKAGLCRAVEAAGVTVRG